MGGGRESRTCQGTDNPRASPQAIAIASYPKAVSRSPLAPAPSGLPKMPACDCWRLRRRPPDPSFSRVGSSAAIRRLVNKWAWETLSGRKLPRAGARGGYWRGPDFCGQSKRSSWPGVCLRSPLLSGQRREYPRRKLTRMRTGKLGRKPAPKAGEGEGGILERSGSFLSPSRLQTVFYVSWRLSGGDPVSGAETLADSPVAPLGDQASAGRRTPLPSRGGEGSRVGSLDSTAR